MKMTDRITGLSKITNGLILACITIGLLHHADHALRVDHSGWPFTPHVNAFTGSPIAYPILIFALIGPFLLFWARWLLLMLFSMLTLFAHSVLESPQMQYAMWAHNRSLEASNAGIHNLLGIQSSFMGVLAATVAMTLNILLVTATVAMLADGFHRSRAKGMTDTGQHMIESIERMSDAGYNWARRLLRPRHVRSSVSALASLASRTLVRYYVDVGKGRLGVVSPSPSGNGSSGLWPRPGSPRRTAGAIGARVFVREGVRLRNAPVEHRLMEPSQCHPITNLIMMSSLPVRVP